MRTFTILVLLAVSVFVAFGGPIQDRSFSARSDGNYITLQWVSQDEAGVLRYELERKAGANGQYVSIAQIDPRGNNNGYTYVDESAFMRTTESVYYYRINVVYANGSSVYYGPITVSHSVSSVRRTWGSIKAMFR
jgi:hypothetical protein